MTLSGLQAWSGHRSPDTTKHCARITPTTPAKAYQHVGYLARNVRAIEVHVYRRCRPNMERTLLNRPGNTFISDTVSAPVASLNNAHIGWRALGVASACPKD